MCFSRKVSDFYRYLLKAPMFSCQIFHFYQTICKFAVKYLKQKDMANIDLGKRNTLESDIDAALADSVSSLSSVLSAPQEPDYIAALTCNFPDILKGVLSSHIPHLKFSVCGCYVHQKPKIRFDDPSFPKKEMELGDLLIVYKEDDGSKVLYNSLLLQAKMAKKKFPQTVPRKEEHQLTLYDKWPRFKYIHAPLIGTTRDIYPKSIHAGGQYLLIDCNRPAIFFLCATPSKKLSPSSSFAEQLIRLIEFKTGDVFFSRSSSYIVDDWSNMIWDLLDLTKTFPFNTFNRRKARYTNTNRQWGDAIDLLSVNDMKDTIEVLRDKFGNDSDNIDEDNAEGNSGISLICIEARNATER